MKKLVIIQTVVPDYRKGFFASLARALGDNFALYAGSHYFEKTVVTDMSIPHTAIRNVYLLQSRFLVQLGVLPLVTSADVLVLELNPRIITNWLLLLLRALLRKKTVVWGHAWPRKGQQAKSDVLRHCMRKLAVAIVVYTEKQKTELQLKMPYKKILAAPNALFTTAQMTPVTNNPRHLIYVGRLTKAKKILFLVDAFKQVLPSLAEDVQLLIVGDGEEKERVLAYLTHHNLEDRVKVYGHISDYNRLRELYSTSIFSISPGYVGLSITQSLGFGVPMLISRDENHSPEIEAAIIGENALFFETDTINSFCQRVLDVYQDPSVWIDKREAIASRCARDYSVETMGGRFYRLHLNTLS